MRNMAIASSKKFQRDNIDSSMGKTKTLKAEKNETASSDTHTKLQGISFHATPHTQA